MPSRADPRGCALFSDQNSDEIPGKVGVSFAARDKPTRPSKGPGNRPARSDPPRHLLRMVDRTGGVPEPLLRSRRHFLRLSGFLSLFRRISRLYPSAADARI